MPRVFFFSSFLSGIERQVLNSPETYEDKFHFYVPFENDLFYFFFLHVLAFLPCDIIITKVTQITDVYLCLFLLYLP